MALHARFRRPSVSSLRQTPLLLALLLLAVLRTCGASPDGQHPRLHDEFSLAAKLHPHNDTHIANYLLEGDAHAVLVGGTTAVDLLPPRRMARGVMSTYYPVHNLSAWVLSVELEWAPPAAAAAFDAPPAKDASGDPAIESGMNIWWAEKPYVAEEDAGLDATIAIGGSKPFDGLTLSMDAPNRSADTAAGGASAPVQIVGRLSYLPSGNRYRVGRCSLDLRTGRRVRIDIRYHQRALKVIFGTQGEDKQWHHEYCIHSSPVDLAPTDRYISISARNSAGGSKESIRILATEFYSLDPTWTPNLLEPKLRRTTRLVRERLLHIQEAAAGNLASDLFLGHDSAHVHDDAAHADKNSTNSSASSYSPVSAAEWAQLTERLAALEASVKATGKLVRSLVEGQQALLTTSHSLASAVAAARGERAEVTAKMRSHVDTWGEMQNSRIETVTSLLQGLEQRQARSHQLMLQSKKTHNSSWWLALFVLLIVLPTAAAAVAQQLLASARARVKLL